MFQLGVGLGLGLRIGSGLGLGLGSGRGLERDEADHAKGERGQEERGDELVVEAEPPADDALGGHDGEGLQ